MSEPEHVDVVVVGAGSSGATLAGRLSERADRRVLVVDSGPDRDAVSAGGGHRDPDRLPSADDPLVSHTPVEVGRVGGQLQFVQGRLVGGSSAVNGAYFVRPTRADMDRWAASGNDRWSFDALLPAFRRLESDLDLGLTELHGGDGPIPVQRHGAPLHPVTAAFFESCAARGHPEHPDLNDGGDRGWGLVPRNLDDTGRVDTAAAYLDPVRGRPNLDVRGGWLASDLVVERGRVVGVQRWGPGGPAEVVRADQVVLCAGALHSPSMLERAREVGGDAPTTRWQRAARSLGGSVSGEPERSVALHPAIDLSFEPTAGVELATSPLVQGALHLVLGSGAVAEVLAICRPYGRATGAAPDDRSLALRVSLMSPRTRALRRSGHGSGWLEMRWPGGWAAADRADLRESVRVAVALATSGPLARLVETWNGPASSALAEDAALDEWIAQRVVVSMHAAGTAPMGDRRTHGSVVDQTGRVHDLDGVRIVDTSILPDLPSRGPACMAIALAEHLATTFD